MIIPDEETIQRIRHLSRVGTALYEATNEYGYQTDFYSAKEALKKFQEGIVKLQLDEATMKGIDNLIKYLDGKIDKRLDASI